MKWNQLFKTTLQYPLIYFIATVSYGLIFGKTINWRMSITITVMMIAFFAIYNWTKTPYKWKKKN